MDDSFRIQVSSRLVDQLDKGGDKLQKKKTRKPKAKIPNDPVPRRPEVKEQQKKISDDSGKPDGTPAAAWSVPPPYFVPVNTPVNLVAAELDAIRSVVEKSEKVVERLQKQEAEMLEEVTKKAKELHEKEFILPKAKTIPCLEEKKACEECYKENTHNTLKCGSVVNRFADCARRVRQQMSSPTKLAT